MPDLPALTLSQAHYDRVVAAFPGATLAAKAAAYKAWLTGNLIDYAATAEARRIDEAANAAKAAKLAALAASLPTRPGEVAPPTPKPILDGASVLNVKDYGATGDGTTDDTSAFTAAFTAAPAGSVVWVPAGMFSTNSLTVPAGVHLDGRGTLKLRPVASGSPRLVLLSEGATLRNLTLDYGTGHGTPGNIVKMSSRTTVTGCTFLVRPGANAIVGIGDTGNPLIDALVSENRFTGEAGCRGATQFLNNLQNVRVIDNLIVGTVSGVTCYSANWDQFDIIVSRNQIQVATPGTNSIPIEIQRATRVNVSDNIVVGGTHGLSIGSTKYLVCSGNFVRDQTSYGIEAGSGSHQTYTSNVLEDNHTGFDLSAGASGSNILIQGNIVRRCTGSVNGDGIRLGNSLASGATWDNVSIIGNVFDELLGAGTPIQIFGGAPKRNFVISGNVCTIPSGTAGSRARAIRVENVTRCLIADNLLSIGTTAFHDGASQLGALEVVGASTEVEVLNNSIRSTTGGILGSNGILTHGTLGAVTVKGNTITGFRAGFTNNAPGSLTGSLSTVIADNLISDCTMNYELMAGAYLTRTKRTYEAAAAPTAGTWAVGDMVWNTAPAAGGTPGWVCTTAGTPGTWKAMSNLAP